MSLPQHPPSARLPASPFALKRIAVALLLALGFAVLLSPSVSARDLTRDEALALEATVSAFDRAVRESNYTAMVDAMPPRILGALAKATDVPVSRWKSSAAAMMRNAFAEATLLEFSMRLDRASSGTLSDGMPYALIPTQTNIVMNGVGRIESEAHTLALFEDGRWYVMRLNDGPQTQQLRDAYPALQNVELPSGSMKFLD